MLHGVTLHVAPGEHVALVGRTGAGKTSIVHLLAGLYEPWQGTVRVAGHNPRALSDEEKRRVFGIVPQASQLFSGTVLENLTLKDESGAGIGRDRGGENQRRRRVHPLPAERLPDACCAAPAAARACSCRPARSSS